MVPSAINLRCAFTYCMVGPSHGPFLFSSWPISGHKDARRSLLNPPSKALSPMAQLQGVPEGANTPLSDLPTCYTN
ncbi:hypothetical protein [Oryza sativa Japonica Group]|uniref:Uncharacterized protein OJ1123_G09.17 n=1 Tax=Oryza sativa subsp. japonica TaxID=39947 RepID=Q5VNJ8_ORYSJ|nr:hypothetical protein [Oryza sativa Japonica Group]